MPGPPGSTSVFSGSRRRCVTVVPVTRRWSEARALCRELGRDLVRPLGSRASLLDGQLRQAIGRVQGWLRATGGGRRPRWPRNSHPARLWFEETIVRRENGAYWRLLSQTDSGCDTLMSCVEPPAEWPLLLTFHNSRNPKPKLDSIKSCLKSMPVVCNRDEIGIYCWLESPRCSNNGAGKRFTPLGFNVE